MISKFLSKLKSILFKSAVPSDTPLKKEKKATKSQKTSKTQIIEVNTLLKFHDTSESKKRSHFEMTYTSIIKLNEQIEDKKILQKIILCDVQKEIYPELEKALLNLLHTSGYPNIKFEKKVDFDELYKKQFN